MLKRTFFILCVAIVFSSCRSLNPSVMFRADDNYPYQVDQTIGNIEYRIASNDIISLSVYTNDGFKLIDLTASTASVTDGATGLMPYTTQYHVDIEGMVKLPIIGKIKLRDKTIREAEAALEQQYSIYYNKPFVVLNVINRRVLVFPGSGGAGKVVPMTNENITLIEALALAGGITESGKAYRIKLIRGDIRNPQVQHIDLSTIDGMKQSNLLLQANDIIYVEPVPRISERILSQITPIVGILTSFLLIYDVIVNRTNN